MSLAVVYGCVYSGASYKTGVMVAIFTLIVTAWGLLKVHEGLNAQSEFPTLGDVARAAAVEEEKKFRLRRFAVRVYPVMAAVLLEVMERKRRQL